MKTKKGFALLELAVALVVIGIVSSFIFEIAFTMRKRSQFQNMKENQEIILCALASYLMQNNCLPCPAADLSGISVENCNDSLSKAVGFVPYRTLGIPESSSIDGLGRPFIYAVDSYFTATTRLLRDKAPQDMMLPIINYCYFCDLFNVTDRKLEVIDASGKSVVDYGRLKEIDPIIIVVCSAKKDSQPSISENMIKFSETKDSSIRWLTRNALLTKYAKTAPCH